MKENSNFLFVIDYFFSISIVDFFVFTCAVYRVILIKCNLNVPLANGSNFSFAIALKNYNC